MPFVSRFLVLAVVAVLAVPGFAQLVVTPSNTQGWTFPVGDANAGTLPPPSSFLAPGFETPPLGSGSVHLAVGPDGGDNAQARQPGYAGVLLSDITALSYSTFTQVDGSGDQSPYLILQVDTDGDTGIEQLFFFEPVYQGPTFFPSNPQGPLVDDTWQTWDALNGGWYTPTGLAGSGPGTNVKSWATLLAALPPNAAIINSSTGAGGVRIVTGFGAGAWDNYLGAADNFTIGVSGVNTTYDFEAGSATLVTVTEPTPDGWTFQIVDDDSDSITTGDIDFVTGPGTPPLGDGSIEFDTGAEGEDGVQARNNLYDGQFLRDLGALSYSTYIQDPGSDTQAPYLILDVDYDNDGVRDDLLFFEPAYQTAGFCPSNPQAGVATGTWQTWEAANGCWYSLFGTAGTGPGVNVRPLTTILAAQPDARLSTNIAGGSLRIVTGFGDGAWDNFIGNADALTVSFLSNNTTFDFEPVPTINISDVVQAEGTGGVTNFVFNLTLSEPVSQTVTVDFATADGTATAADLDYTSLTGTATFNPQSTSTTITIAVTPDNKFELDETFFVNLTNPQFATVADPQAQGTIQNDDLQPTISFLGDVAQAEGAGPGNTNFPFTVQLSNPSYQTITVQFTTVPDTATEGTDYTDATGVLTFVPGDTAEIINVPVAGETVTEPNETFFVNLDAPTNATISDNQAVGTILNDDSQPVIHVEGDLSTGEGDPSTPGGFTFRVILSNPSSETVTVDYTTTPDTALDGSDYTGVSGTFTFVPGDTVESVFVSAIGDFTTEPTEQFFFDIANPTNATLGDAQAVATILDDDGVPSISIDNVALPEGSGNFVFTVTLSNPSAQTITVNYTTNPGTALEGTDYQDASGTLTFVAGDTSETITVPIIADNIHEPDETFTVDLSSPANAVIGDGQGLGTIQNDDALPTILITDVSQNEGNAANNFLFTVTLSNPSSSNVTVNFTTNPGTATEGTDYTDNTGVVTFVAGDVSETIAVEVLGDTDFEPNETFTVDLSSPANAAFGDDQGLGTILNDDGPIADVSITKTGPNRVPRGAPVTYTITVNNAGPQTASNVVVTDVLDPSVIFVSATPSQGSCSGTTTVTCTLGAIASGGSATISLVVNPPDDGVFTNTATVSNTPETDPTPGNNAGTTSAFIGSADIPTLSQWALIALMAALMAMAVVKLK